MSYTRRNEPYNKLSERLETVERLGCYRHRWSHLGEDLYGNRQKLYCRTQDGVEFVIDAEYLDADTAILSVAPEFVSHVFEAVSTIFPAADIVGEQGFIRIK